MNPYIIKSSLDSKQLIKDDAATGDLIEPFFDFRNTLMCYYENTYHRRCIMTKANILSQIEESDLQNFLTDSDPKSFLYALMIQLEIFGNAFIEKAGKSKFAMYLLPTHEARLLLNGEIVQFKNGAKNKLEGFHTKYYSPFSRHYGEPDYMAAVRKLNTEGKIDRFNDVFFENNAMPNFAIMFENAEPTKEQLEAFQQFFSNSFKGFMNAHRTLVMSANSMNTENPNARVRMEDLNRVNDMSFEKFKLLNREEIIAAHNMPPRLVGIMSSGQLGGQSELIMQLHQFNELEVKPKIEKLEYFFESIGVKLRLKPMDITSFKDDADVVTGLVQLGIISVDEARQIIGWQKSIRE